MSATANVNEEQSVGWLMSVSCLVYHTDSVLMSPEDHLEETRPG